MSKMGLQARVLKSSEIPQAFALVQFVSPQASFGSWSRSARELLDRVDCSKCGILAVQDSRGVILGMLQYNKCLRLPHHTTMLGLDPVVCGASARHQMAIMQALLHALEGLARRSGCNSLASQLPRHLDGKVRARLRENLQSRGYGYEERSFVKRLDSSLAAATHAGPIDFDAPETDPDCH